MTLAARQQRAWPKRNNALCLLRIFADDLEDLADWIAQDDPRHAVKLLRQLRLGIEKVARNPLLYRLRPDIGDAARVAVMGKHVVLFWIDGRQVRFERLLYGPRDLPAHFRKS